MTDRDEPHARCPACGKPPNPDCKPFCSKRCADVDLGRWLKGAYVIPGREDSGHRSEADDGATSGKVRKQDGDNRNRG